MCTICALTWRCPRSPSFYRAGRRMRCGGRDCPRCKATGRNRLSADRRRGKCPAARAPAKSAPSAPNRCTAPSARPTRAGTIATGRAGSHARLHQTRPRRGRREQQPLISRYRSGTQPPSVKMARRLDDVLDAGGQLVALARTAGPPLEAGPDSLDADDELARSSWSGGPAPPTSGPRRSNGWSGPSMTWRSPIRPAARRCCCPGCAATWAMSLA